MEKNKKLLKSTISKNAHWMINKKLAKGLGLEATLLLQHFIDLESGFFHGEFYQQQDRLCEDLFLSRRQIDSAIKTLEGNGLITVTKKGIPRKNYYSINHEVILEFLQKETLENEVDLQSVQNERTRDLD